MLPETLLEPMARAQVARDVVMADIMLRALADHEFVFLLAGNGHVNRDIGVPHWLIAHGNGQQLVATGYLERGNEAERAHFDSVHMVAPAEREDPCAAFAAGRGGAQ